MKSRILPFAVVALLLALANDGLTEPVPGNGLPASAPSDALLRLVPPDAAVVVTVDNLRDNTNAVLKSTLDKDLRQLPAVRDWFASEKFRQFERSRTQIETVLGVNLTELRDELLGDAVVLALRHPPDTPPDASQARGMLLVKARNQALLDRLIRAVNSTQQESGELTGVVERQHSGKAYHVRQFPPEANRPTECYVVYPDGTFAFSNSEMIIESVIDRKAQSQDGDHGAKTGSKVAPGLGDLARLRAVRNQLPGLAVARLFVDPRQFERLLASQPRPTKPGNARLAGVLERYLSAIDCAGAALTWSADSVVIHSVETLSASSLDPWLRQWAGDVRPTDSQVSQMPPTALAFATCHLDALAALGLLEKLKGEDDPPNMANLEQMLTGLLLGQDLRTKVLPRLGPGLLAYFDTPSETDDTVVTPDAKPANQSAWPFPLVVVVSLGVDPDHATAALADAADNALRTVLAVRALDDKRFHGRSRIANRRVAGVTVTTLDPAIPFAYAVDRAHHRLVLSTSTAAVARYLENLSAQGPSDRQSRLGAAIGANVETYASIDLDAINHLAARHRASLLRSLAARQERSVGEVDRDLAHVLALAKLFRAVFVTTRFEADATAVHRSLGLIRQDAGPK